MPKGGCLTQVSLYVTCLEGHCWPTQQKSEETSNFIYILDQLQWAPQGSKSRPLQCVYIGYMYLGGQDISLLSNIGLGSSTEWTALHFPNSSQWLCSTSNWLGCLCLHAGYGIYNTALILPGPTSCCVLQVWRAETGAQVRLYFKTHTGVSIWYRSPTPLVYLCVRYSDTTMDCRVFYLLPPLFKGLHVCHILPELLLYLHVARKSLYIS